jgi:hypothetical protein
VFRDQSKVKAQSPVVQVTHKEEFKMKRLAWLFLVVLGSALLVQAQSSTKSMEMNGTICRSACVTQQDNLATCNKDCTDTNSEAVLVDDQGIVHPIAQESQNMCHTMMGKHVKMTAVPTEGERERELRILDIKRGSGAG